MDITRFFQTTGLEPKRGSTGARRKRWQSMADRLSQVPAPGAADGAIARPGKDDMVTGWAIPPPLERPGYLCCRGKDRVASSLGRQADMKHLFPRSILVMLYLLLSACGETAQVTPTPVPSPSATSIPTLAPSPTGVTPAPFPTISLLLVSPTS